MTSAASFVDAGGLGGLVPTRVGADSLAAMPSHAGDCWCRDFAVGKQGLGWRAYRAKLAGEFHPS